MFMFGSWTASPGRGGLRAIPSSLKVLNIALLLFVFIVIAMVAVAFLSWFMSGFMLHLAEKEGVDPEEVSKRMCVEGWCEEDYP